MNITNNLKIDVVAVLGKKNISIKKLIGLEVGKILKLDKNINAQVEVCADKKLIGNGEICINDNNIDVKITNKL